MKIRLLPIAFVFLFLFTCSHIVSGQCSCAYITPDSKNVEIVFSGRILDITEEDKSSKYKIQISENFRGIEKQETIELLDSFYNCNNRRYVNKEYLFMAAKDQETGKIKVVGCSYSYENRYQEKQFLEILRWEKSSQKQGGILVGKVVEFVDDEGNSRKPDGVNLVFAENGKGEKFSAKVENDGFYKLENLNEGKYKVFLKLPETLTTYGDIHDFDNEKSLRYVEILNNNGKIADFSVSVNGIISGRVIDTKGLPVRSIKVNLFRLENDGEEEENNVETDRFGNYIFKGLLAGNYLIKVGAEDWYLEPDSIEAAFPITYFPNKRKKEAEIIEMGKAQIVKDKNITLLPSFKKRLIKGQVLMPNGQPARNADISVQIKRKDDQQTLTSGWYVLTKTDLTGKFSMYAYDKTEYLINADIDKPIDDVRVEVLFSSKCIFIPQNGEIQPLKIILEQGDRRCNEEDFGF